MDDCARKEPLYKTITPAEMLRMRHEEGLTNEQIAEKCDTSAVTVRKYIGNQGFRGCNKHSPLDSTKNSAPPVLPVQPMAQLRAKPTNSIIHVSTKFLGEMAEYTITSGRVQIYDERKALSMEIGIAELESFIREFVEVHEQMKQEERNAG